MKIVAYRVIEANVNRGTSVMEAEINAAISAGWQPFGAMTAATMPGSIGSDLYYAQPMVKWEDQK